VRRLDLTEHGLSTAVPLTPAELRGLQDARVVTVTPSPVGADHWDLRPSSLVGVIRLGDLEVRIRPKIPVSRLLFLLAYARDQSGWRDILAGFQEESDVVTAVAMGFVHHAERALMPHVLHGYLAVEDDLTTLRGRMREGDQLRRRFGIPLPLAVAYDEFTIDIPENRLLLTAALRLQRLWGVPPAGQRALRRIVQRLEGVTELAPGSKLPTVVISRLNEQIRTGAGPG
jgi:5-methylcytosine-specific restriction enzyme subunit McrC